MIKTFLRFVLAAILLIMSLWLFVPVTLGIMNIGGISGGIFLLICALAAVFFPQLKELIKRACRKKAAKIALCGAGIFLALCVCYAGILSGLMLNAMLSAPSDSTAPVIVLGCKVNPSGNPSLMLQKRIDAAADYLAENPEAFCIVSGGQGADEPQSEAQVMFDGLVKLGIDPSRIIKEDKSTSTMENLEFSLELLAQHNISAEEIVIVTDGFHQYRAHLMAQSFGCSSVSVNAETPPWLLPAYWVREWLGLSHYMIFG